MFFILSKLLSFFMSPFLWVLILLLFSFLLKKKRLKQLAFKSSIIILLIFSNTIIFLEAMRLWEVKGHKIENIGYHDVAIVLGGMASYNNDLERLSLRRGGDRIWQAIHLYKLGKVGKILISGNDGHVIDRGLDEAVQFKIVLIDLGIPAEDILVENISKNTYENAVESKKVLANAGFESASVLLVTSAIHMRRSEACFVKAGFEGFDTFSTDQYTGEKRGYYFDQFIIPDAATLMSWYGLLHEWIGYFTYWIMGYV